MPAVRVVDEHLLSPVLVYSGSGGVFQNELQLDTQGGLIREQIGSLLVVKNDFNVVAALTGSVFTGPVSFESGITGSLQVLPDGSPFIRGSGSISVTSGTDGSITVAAPDNFLTLESLTQASSITFNGDVYIEGTLFGGSPLDVASDISVSGSISTTHGITGSLTSLSDGSPYIIAGDGISIVTGSKGQITISSTIDTGSFDRGGSGGVLTELVLNEMPTGVMDGTNKTFTLASDPANTSSVMLWLNGQLLTQGEVKDYSVSGRNIDLSNTDLTPDDVLTVMYPKSVVVKKFALNESASFVTISGSLGLQVEKTPEPSQSLMLFRNGQLLTQGTDYNLDGKQIQMLANFIASDDIFLATYSHVD
jgi:hypothetical protein